MGRLMKMGLENIDYTKLSLRGLKDLMNQRDQKAFDEHYRRYISGELKTRKVSMEDLARIFKVAYKHDAA